MNPPVLSSAATVNPPARAEHPTLVALRGRRPREPERLTLARVRALALEAGADDAGVVALAHPDLAEERPFVLRALPAARSLVALVLRMHPDDIRSPSRSIANQEFHRTGAEADEVARRLAVALAALGHPSINPAMAFPMEMDHFPGRTWVVSHKRVAVAAQLGRVGLHRSVIHPRFGSFILLATVLTTADIDGEPARLDFNPCLDCKLCVAACPVGAIEPEGGFRFSACYDHNYREFMSGFNDVLEEVAESKDRQDLRRRVSASESASLWQSLAYKPNYKAAYCIAVCPAGEDLIGPFVADRAAFLREVVKPLTGKQEPIYVVPGSDAEAHVRRRFPHKEVRLIRSSLRPAGARAFFRSLPLLFQRGPAAGLHATYHFDLGGAEPVQVTVRLVDGALQVDDGLQGTPDLTIQARSEVWLGIVTRAQNPVLAVLSLRLRLRGDRKLLPRFAACFPR